MNDLKSLRKGLGTILVNRGFNRKGSNYYMRGETVTCVVNLQTYSFGPLVFVNWCLYLSALGDEKFPKEEHCHIRIRAEWLDTVNFELRTILDLRDPMPLEDRLAAFARFVDDYLLPFTKRMLLPNEWKHLLKGEIRNVDIRKEVRELAQED